MSFRVVLVLSVPFALVGCASEAPSPSGFGATSALAIASPVAQPGGQYRKTMSDRVLTAIALERVTGLKPDPARLVE